MDETFVDAAEKSANASILAGIERARHKEAAPPGFDGECVCGNDIPTARVALGYYRCISCQSLMERRSKR